MNGPLPALSDEQLAAVAARAGFAGEALVTMIAIALAESGGDPDNIGDETITTSTWGPSVGLAQIRSLRAHFGRGLVRDADRLDEADFNMRSAYAISSGGTNWRPWSAWTSGKYRGFLERARAAAAGGGGARGLIPIPLPGGGTIGIGPDVGEALEGALAGLARIALVGIAVAGGAALVVAGGWRAVTR